MGRLLVFAEWQAGRARRVNRRGQGLPLARWASPSTARGGKLCYDSATCFVWTGPRCCLPYGATSRCFQRPGALLFPRTTACRPSARPRSLVAAGKARSRKNAAKAPAKATGKREGAGKPAAASRRAGNLSGCRTEGRRIPGARHARAGGAGRDARRGQPAVRGTVGDDPLPPAAGADLCRCRLGKSTTLVLRVVFMLCHLGSSRSG